MRGYGMPSKFEEPVKRLANSGYPTVSPGTGSSLTPLQNLEGTITPNGLHFERHHSGVPDIDAAQHRLLIHGLVRRALNFSPQALARYPMVSRTCFVECAGNSSRNTGPQQEAQLKELDELVRANKVAERLAQIKASKA